MKNEFNLANLITIVLARKMPLIIVCAVAIVISFVVTHPKLDIISPDYESVATIFPSNPSLTDRPYLFKTESGGELSIDLFGNKEDIDRLISISKSSQILTHVIYKFNLINHYEIDTTKEYYLSNAIGKLKKNYEVLKNEYNAIEIHVVDKNKELAADLANEIVSKIDEVNKRMVLDNRIKMVSIFKEQLEKKNKEVTELTDSLTSLRTKYKVFDIARQSEILTQEITTTESDLKARIAERDVLKWRMKGRLDFVKLEAEIKGLEKKLMSLTKEEGEGMFNLESFTKGADIIRVLQSKLVAAMEERRIINVAYEQYTVASNPNISSLYVMEKAYPSEKAVPLQLIAVIATFLITLFVSVTVAVIVSTFRN